MPIARTREWHRLPVLIRNELWNKFRKEKLEARRSWQKRKSVEGCTFSPSINRSGSHYREPSIQPRERSSTSKRETSYAELF